MDSHSEWMRGGTGTNDPERFSCINETVATPLTRAYGIMRVQLSGPGWLDTERFDCRGQSSQGRWIVETASVEISGPRLAAALQEQLGLKLQAKKAPVETVVIVREKVPTEN